MKTIAISRSLGELGESLENLGYEVFFEDDIRSEVDVFIYSSQENSQPLYTPAQLTGTAFFPQTGLESHHIGTLLINGANKTLDEILYILENKFYSPLFS